MGRWSRGIKVQPINSPPNQLIKTKLEQTLDELEDSLEREKKGRTDLDKSKRKLETEMKFTKKGGKHKTRFSLFY